VKDLINVTTFSACKSIEEAANAQCDMDMLHIISGVNSDLVAAEAKYHKACCASYISKTNLKHKTVLDESGEDTYSQAFTLYARDIQADLDEVI
jgi:hypothetical protein